MVIAAHLGATCINANTGAHCIANVNALSSFQLPVARCEGIRLASQRADLRTAPSIRQRMYPAFESKCADIMDGCMEMYIQGNGF